MLTSPITYGLWDVLPLAVLVLFSLCFLLQMFFFWGFFSRLAFHKPDDNSLIEHPVSVVICARNEYYNLRENLPLLLSQDYPNYEVIVVNDSSTDPTPELLEEMKNTYGNLRVFSLEKNLNFFKGKKFPLALGIKSAAHDIVLLTDADCKPASTQWVRTMQSGFSPGKDIVLGYGGYIKQKGLLNMLIRFETLHTAMQYLSFALGGRPYMGVGRNLAYRKQLFNHEKGFSAHYTVHSGDDDLFVNRVSNGNNTAVEISKESHTLSHAKKSWGDWFIQKRRHLTTGHHYSSSSKRFLALYSVSKALMFLSLIPLIAWIYEPVIFGAAIIVYIFSLIILVYLAGRKLNESTLVFFAPVFDIFLMIIIPVIYLSNLLKRPDRWK
jgi:cellulose synthase/poly-beta-1,6-N-acetylglucosamine synthase-like glycosyltransferase